MPNDAPPNDVPLEFPLNLRFNWAYRFDLISRLDELGVSEAQLPLNFFERHWRDKQSYIEKVLGHSFCTRCKLPTNEPIGPIGRICSTCKQAADTAWSIHRLNRQSERAKNNHIAYERRKAKKIAEQQEQLNALDARTKLAVSYQQEFGQNIQEDAAKHVSEILTTKDALKLKYEHILDSRIPREVKTSQPPVEDIMKVLNRKKEQTHD
jgi:hypothetical protein